MFNPLPKSRLRLLVCLLTITALSACLEVETPNSPPDPNTSVPSVQLVMRSTQSGPVTVESFAAIVRHVEPIAESECRARTQGANCDFKVVVDSNASAPANAFQSVDATGRPVLTFTVALLADLQNSDELAFILGHEAAHHIRGHLDRTQESAAIGGLLGGVLAAAVGADAATVETVQNLGATVGARRYSKSYELEADQLGTVIAYRAGYNPIRGAAFFTRIADPGDEFLGSHPPNDQRIETVRRTMATL
ncbi:M48 family metallopeptidase [Pacificibacter marinus]|uniref:M48 family metallopeptidase n=1 Tax=Pacificibacter marinus TaxID=658057 RepID=UPI00339D8CF7